MSKYLTDAFSDYQNVVSSFDVNIHSYKCETQSEMIEVVGLITWRSRRLPSHWTDAWRLTDSRLQHRYRNLLLSAFPDAIPANIQSCHLQGRIQGKCGKHSHWHLQLKQADLTFLRIQTLMRKLQPKLTARYANVFRFWGCWPTNTHQGLWTSQLHSSPTWQFLDLPLVMWTVTGASARHNCDFSHKVVVMSY